MISKKKNYINEIDVVGMLQQAIYAGDDYNLVRLIKEGIDVNITDDNGQTPLHWAVETGYLNTTEVLLDHGANANALDNNFDTPISLSIDLDSASLLNLFINKKSDISVVIRRKGINYTYIDCCYEKKAFITVTILRQSGLDIENSYYVAVDSNAREWLNIIAPGCYYAANGGCENLQKLLESGLNPNQIPVNPSNKFFRKNDCPLIVLAAMRQDIDMVDLLLRYSAYINASSPAYGVNALHYACLHNAPELVEMLLAHNADVNASPTDGNTPLIIACDEGLVDIVKMLLKFGAEIKSRNRLGKSAFDYAILHRNNEIIGLLSQNM